MSLGVNFLILCQLIQEWQYFMWFRIALLPHSLSNSPPICFNLISYLSYFFARLSSISSIVCGQVGRRALFWHDWHYNFLCAISQSVRDRWCYGFSHINEGVLSGVEWGVVIHQLNLYVVLCFGGNLCKNNPHLHMLHSSPSVLSSTSLGLFWCWCWWSSGCVCTSRHPPTLLRYFVTRHATSSFSLGSIFVEKEYFFGHGAR